jgi:fimbrial isopeptide formation D2 family protein
VSGFSIVDELDELNAAPMFQVGTLNIVQLPAGADASNTDANGGAAGTGVLDVGNLNLAGPGDSLTIEFEVLLTPAILDGTIVYNQSDLFYNGSLIAVSDDPNVNGPADPTIAGDEDPTRILIQGLPPTALLKATTQATATIGETFSYQVTVPLAPHAVPLYDVRITDDLAASAADLEFVSVTKISGSGNWTSQNSGTATDLVIEDPANGIDIPAGEQAVIEIAVRLSDTPTNVAGLTFTNTAAYTYRLADGEPLTERPGDLGTSGPMTIVEPDLTLEKDGPLQLRVGQVGSFSLNLHNIGGSPAYNLTRPTAACAMPRLRTSWPSSTRRTA